MLVIFEIVTVLAVLESARINGECNQRKLECAHGYRKRGNTCIEDGDVNERAKKLSEWVENRLCEAYADFLCYGTGIIWVQGDDISNDLDGNQLLENYGSDNPVYVHTKMRAIETISGLLETRTNSHGKKEFKCPDLVVEHYKPFTCRLRQWISEHALVIVPVCALVVGFTFLVWKIQRRWYLSTRGEELYHQVCDILEESALMSKRVNTECEPWVVASRLRDHLLSPKERKDPVLWKKVEDLVQEDSRVDRYPKLVKGDSKVVWEWQVEGSLSSGRMRKKVDSSKLKYNDGIKENFDKGRHELKPDDKYLYRAQDIDVLIWGAVSSLRSQNDKILANIWEVLLARVLNHICIECLMDGKAFPSDPPGRDFMFCSDLIREVAVQRCSFYGRLDLDLLRMQCSHNSDSCLDAIYLDGTGSCIS
ncbi:unnamed protein product [Dovyalis caffra]|uniref:Man1/Src1-like C-terminal domain-containing protein n=1 Tax=Dovyalis caffra TaxID=77055 RepID=A0AAV1SQ98_9ROSI|nr:unnamed protein product [Dovyalis caffra]